MPQELAGSLYDVLTRELPNLLALAEEQAVETRRPGSWTRKHELGHLIDSAANNHIRIANAAIHGAFEGPSYAQEEWVRLHGYDELPWSSLVHFWFRYNALLVQLIQRVDPARLSSPCTIAGRRLTLEEVIGEYVLHMQHHLDQILHRDQVTQYPRTTAQPA